MTSDDATPPPDRRFFQPGLGQFVTFWCPACGKPKAPGGRKMKRVLGLRQYVCAKCAERKK